MKRKVRKDVSKAEENKERKDGRKSEMKEETRSNNQNLLTKLREDKDEKVRG